MRNGEFRPWASMVQVLPNTTYSSRLTVQCIPWSPKLVTILMYWTVEELFWRQVHHWTVEVFCISGFFRFQSST
jgi:hypothetical protein